MEIKQSEITRIDTIGTDKNFIITINGENVDPIMFYALNESKEKELLTYEVEIPPKKEGDKTFTIKLALKRKVVEWLPYVKFECNSPIRICIEEEV